MQTVFLFDEKLSINLPEDFIQTTDADASEVFPFYNKPQVIFASKGFSNFLTLSLLEKSLDAEETQNAARGVRKLVWSMYPSSIITEESTMQFGNMKCSGFSFRTGTEDAQKFNTMFVVSFEGKLLFGTFGCGLEDDKAKNSLIKLLEDAKYRRDAGW